MNEEQQKQLSGFIALFAWMLKEGSAPREQAELVLQASASCMIASVFDIGEDHPESDLARRVIQVALKLQYEPDMASRRLQA